MYEDINFLVTATCGSKLFGLDNDKFAHSYLSIIITDTPSYYDLKQSIVLEPYPNTNIFCHNLLSMNNINYCASPLIVPSYDAIVSYNSPLLNKFWLNNSIKLSEMNLNVTYQIAIEQANYYIDNEYTAGYGLSIRLIGLMWCRYFTDNIFQARDNFADIWVERYNLAKSGDISTSELKNFLSEIQTPSIARFYEYQNANYELHDQYKLLIDSIIEGGM